MTMSRRNSKSCQDPPTNSGNTISTTNTTITIKHKNQIDDTNSETTSVLSMNQQGSVSMSSSFNEYDGDEIQMNRKRSDNHHQNMILALLLLLFTIAAGTFTWVAGRRNREPAGKPILRFREVDGEYKFRIVQLADLHLGESDEKDAKTWKLVDKVMEEEEPDLIVLSGDQISAQYLKDSAGDEYRMMGEKLSKYSTPWAMIFGSMDDMDHTSRVTNITTPAAYKREDLLGIDQSFHYSLTEAGPKAIFGLTNYILDVFIEDEKAANLYFYDSGGGSLPEQLQQNQINWFYHSFQLHPAAAFQYQPPLELLHTDKCTGQYEEEFQPLKKDPGIVNAMSESARVYFLAVGKNHGNDYCCPFTEDMQVCFARHTGHGGYGDWERGVRVFELTISDPTSYRMDWKSWVRLESGVVSDEVTRSELLTALH